MEKTKVKQQIISSEKFEGQKEVDVKRLNQAIQHNGWLLEALTSLESMVKMHTNLIQSELDLINKKDETSQEQQ